MKILRISSSRLAHSRSAPVSPTLKHMFVAKLRNSSGTAILSLLLAFSAFLLNAPAFAQVADASPAPRTAHSHHTPSLDQRIKVLAKNLDLSEEQQAAVKKILEQRYQETLRLRENPALSGSARIDSLRALQDKTVERIRGVLNDEQKKKYDPLAVRRVPPDPEKRSVDDWLEATKPH